MKEILFLLAAAVKQEFADPGEWRWRLVAAYTLLSANSRLTRMDIDAIDRELAKP